MPVAQRKASTSATSPRPTTSSSLSAAAPSFAPASPLAPPPDVSTIDEFAQTGAYQDDIFDDVVPVDESMHTRPPDDLFADEFTPVEQPEVQQVVREQPRNQQRGRGSGEGARGRGRGRGGGGQVTEQPRAQAKTQAPPTTQVQPEETPASAPPPPQAPTNAPTGPRQTTVPPVRGSRQATGGIRKPKLTESELAEKMASISIKNASLTEAHARAEADAASFAEQESKAKLMTAEKAKAERKDRQQMMGEREKNRMRKLKAMEGREWHAEKEEQDFGKGGKFDGKGFKGDESGYTDGREYLYKEPRGGGVQRGGARGGKEGVVKVPKAEDFPALAPGKKAEDTSLSDAKAEGKSWADQVESATPS
ncbi:hypothetical protein B0A48_10498 [Cryoendolithus antarcticus]|uniref:Uncharacterized protein n=1 Tax=Cryoendolithus antarcticus TaxID=1507870 RepID=A0A1V8SXH8_9PEZI|nr:hypothetical protein B0A48_10498 [Cryoendolithus antarcticus]